jgi:hypothetical protein
MVFIALLQTSRCRGRPLETVAGEIGRACLADWESGRSYMLAAFHASRQPGLAAGATTGAKTSILTLARPADRGYIAPHDQKHSLDPPLPLGRGFARDGVSRFGG